MTMPASGAISFANINTELGVGSTTARSLNDSTTRSLFQVASGAISMSNGYGKASAFNFSPVIAANVANYNIKAAAIANGWNQTDKLVATVTINAGVTVYASSVGTYAMDTGVTFPAGSSITVVNNGTILGKGGTGASGTTGNGGAGGAGGPAFRAQVAMTMTNNGRISGGGGGGGAGSGGGNYTAATGGGGGGGIGNGAAGSGGGAGSLTSGGAGGAGTHTPNGVEINGYNDGGTGGAGGTFGATGGTGGQVYYDDGYGNTGLAGAGGAGGAPGAATSGAVNITWNAVGTRNGTIG